MPDLIASATAPMMTLFSYIHWNVDPIIGTLGPLTFRYYGILFALSLLAGHYIFVREFEREGDDPEQAVILTYWLVAGIVIGSRLGHVFFYDPDYYLSKPIEIFKFWKGGLASHGGTFGLILVIWLYAVVVRQVPFRVIADRFAPAVPPAMLGVRLGNLFNSEVYGRQADVPWAFVFERIDAVPRHPSQLYEMCTGVLMIILLSGINRYYKKHNKKRPLGLMISVMLGVYFSMRFIVEFFKEYQTLKTGLTMGQYLSIPLAVASAIGLWMCLKGPWKDQHYSQFVGRTAPPTPPTPSEDA